MRKGFFTCSLVFWLSCWLPVSAQESPAQSTSTSSPSSVQQNSMPESPLQDIPQSLREISQKLRAIADDSEKDSGEQWQYLNGAQTDRQRLDFSLTSSTRLLQQLKLDHQREIETIKASYDLQIQQLKRSAQQKSLELWLWRAATLVAVSSAVYFAVR